MEVTVEASVLLGTFRAAEMNTQVSTIFESRLVTEYVHLNIEKRHINLQAESLKYSETKADDFTLVPLSVDKENWVSDSNHSTANQSTHSHLTLAHTKHANDAQ